MKTKATGSSGPGAFDDPVTARAVKKVGRRLRSSASVLGSRPPKLT